MVPAAVEQHHLTGDGRGVDYAATALFAHYGQHQLTQARQSEHVDFDLTAGLFHCHRLDGTEVAEAGIVHENVDTAFGLHHGLYAFLHRLLVGDVHPDWHNALFAKRFHQFHAACGGVDLVALAGKNYGGVIAYAAAGAREQYNLAFCLHFFAFLLVFNSVSLTTLVS